MNESPIMIRGYSRSGGTLLATIIDAHPQVAMSYEIYPHLLEPHDCPEKQDLHRLLGMLKRCRSSRALGKVKDRDLRTFLTRTARNGSSPADLVRLVQEHIDEGLSFQDNMGRLSFVARCCRDKMNKEGKTRWGGKASNRFDDYLAVWPRAYLLNVVRDGRDVLASQMTAGDFGKTPEQIAAGWVSTHAKFRKLVQRPDVRAREARYEHLVTDPEREVRDLCEFLELPFAEDMLRFHDKKLTIYEASHLSMDRISKPIDATKVGRWRRELSQEVVASFMSLAGELMAEMGYSQPENAHPYSPEVPSC